MAENDDEHIIARALQNSAFIWYLTHFISGAVSWKDIADKCIGQDNAYCLSLIKSKSWTDKTSTGGSWSERLEELIYERVSLSVAFSTLMLAEVGKRDAVILKIDAKNVSPFVVKILTLIDNIYMDILEVYGIKVRFVTAEELAELDDDCLYINHNRITWSCDLINFKRLCKMLILSDTPLTPANEFVTNSDCINAGFMLWEYLLNDECALPNCTTLPPEPKYSEERIMYVDASKG